MVEPDTPPEPGARQPHGRLERVLRAKLFAVTAETTPPLSADPADVIARAAPLDGSADAVNVTDAAAAKAHMSSLAAASLLAREGIEPVLQLTVRDRNRLALEGELLGAAALGIANVLCLHGDDVAAGDEPGARMVHDLDSCGLMALARTMCDEARLPSGRAIATAPRLLIGAADTPAEPGPEWSAERLRRKIDAGARFFQTQFCFDLGLVRRYIGRLADEGLCERAWFLIGTGPLRSAASARWMNATLWGVQIPEAVIRRLAGAPDEAEEGVRICAEMIEALEEVPGVAGVHLMGPASEAAAAEAIARSRVLERRAAATAGAS